MKGSDNRKIVGTNLVGRISVGTDTVRADDTGIDLFRLSDRSIPNDNNHGESTDSLELFDKLWHPILLGYSPASMLLPPNQ